MLSASATWFLMLSSMFNAMSAMYITPSITRIMRSATVNPARGPLSIEHHPFSIRAYATMVIAISTASVKGFVSIAESMAKTWIKGSVRDLKPGLAGLVS